MWDIKKISDMFSIVPAQTDNPWEVPYNLICKQSIINTQIVRSNPFFFTLWQEILEFLRFGGFSYISDQNTESSEVLF